MDQATIASDCCLINTSLTMGLTSQASHAEAAPYTSIAATATAKRPR